MMKRVSLFATVPAFLGVVLFKLGEMQAHTGSSMPWPAQLSFGANLPVAFARQVLLREGFLGERPLLEAALYFLACYLLWVWGGTWFLVAFGRRTWSQRLMLASAAALLVGGIVLSAFLRSAVIYSGKETFWLFVAGWILFLETTALTAFFRVFFRNAGRTNS